MKTKRLISALVCVLLITAVFAGCSGSGTKSTDTSSNKVTLVYWQHSSAARDDMMKTLAYEFMQANPDINIKMEFIPEADYSTKLTSALATSAAPDVFQVESGMISRLVKAEAIQPLDEKVMPADQIKNDFVPAAVDALQVGGKYYGMPTDMQTIVLYWNKDLLKAAGLDSEKGPQTWDELLDWAKKLTVLKDGKMIQSGWGEKGYHPEVQAFVYENGGKMTDDSGKYVFADDPKSVEAIKFMVDAYKVSKVYDTKFMATWAGFRQGKVAMMLGHPAMYGNLKQTAPNVKLGIGVIPGRNDSHTTAVTSWAYVASKKANSSAATKWIQYLSSKDVEKRWTKSTGELPARKELINDPDLVADPQAKILLSSLNDSKVGTLQTAALNKIWSDAYQKLILTNAPLEDTLKQMQNDLNAEAAKDLK